MVGDHIGHEGGSPVDIAIPDAHLVTIVVGAVLPLQVHDVKHINPNLVSYLHVVDVVGVVLSKYALADSTDEARVVKRFL